jgi:hypothetical protein
MKAKLTSNPEKAHPPISVEFCLGMAGTYRLKILLNRGKVIAAPFGIHSDAYQSKMVKTWCPFGNRGLLQRIKF